MHERFRRTFFRTLFLVAIAPCVWVTPDGLLAQDSVPLEGPLDPSLPAPVQPIQPPALPPAEKIQQTIDSIKEDAALKPELQTQLVDRYTRVLQSLAKATEAKQQLYVLQSTTKSASKRLASIRAQLEQPVDVPVDASQTSSLEEIRTEQARLDAGLRDLQQELEVITTELRTRKEDTQRLPERIIELQERLKTLTGQPPVAEDVPPAIQVAARLERDAALAEAREQLAAARQRLARNEAEADLLPAQRELLKRQIEATEVELAKLNDALADKRVVQIRSAVAAYNQLKQAASEAYQEDANKFAENIGQRIERQTDRVLEAEEPGAAYRLGRAWRSIVDQAAQTESESLQLRSTWTALKEDLEKIDGLVETDLATGRGLSRSVGYLLQRKQAKLPPSPTLNRTRSRLTDTVDMAQSMLTRIEARREDLGDYVPVEPADVAAVEAEVELLRQMGKDVDEYVTDLVTMSVMHDAYGATVDDYRQLINKHLLWVRSAAPYGLSDLQSIDDAAKWLGGRQNLQLLGWALLELPQEHPSVAILWALALGALLYFRSHIKTRLHALGVSASHRLASAMRPTFQAIVWTLLLAVPLSLALVGPGWLLYMHRASVSYLQSVGFALLITAVVVMPIEVLRQVVRQGGLATDHFQWAKSAVRPIQIVLWWIIHAVIPVIFLWRVLEGAEDVKIDLLSLSRPLFTVAMLVVSALLWYITHPRRGAAAGYLAYHTEGWISQLWWLWRPLLVAVPIVLALLSLMGYSYSATQLAFRLYRTIWIATVATILSGLSMRWLLISRRGIAIQQMRQRAAERATAAEQGTLSGPVAEAIDADVVDVSSISAQTQRLINAVLFVFVLLGLYRVWSPILPALAFLDSVPLWPIKDSNGVVIETVTLSNLVLAVPIVGLTVIAVRNVPGLLETVILQRLPLENAVRYAITTLSSYLFATLGIIATAQVLGIHWDSVQWVIAGLGVGLGFGLQEIFANFISGIILLFEQPIRVGDLVTLDGQTGSVTKIRMRATTITNWDRQEMVVPNKNLITGTLINWSLTDSTTRVTLTVGVAYGSDTQKVCRVLQEIVDKHPIAMPGLQQLVTFEQFGDSTLNFTVRCYLPSIERRLQTIHELHMEIDRRFREEGIEIAFPQQDLHIRSIPKEWQLSSADSPSDGSTP